MTDLPVGWSQRPIGEVTGPTRPREKPSTHPDLPFIGMENIEAHSMRLLGTVPASTMRSVAVRFQPGDVLYGRLRPYLNKVYQPEFEGYCSAEFIVLPGSEQILGSFLKYFLNSAIFVTFASHLNTGDRPRVDWKQLATFEVPIPPLNEQRRIVTAIEEQLSRLDAAHDLLARVRKGLRLLEAAISATVLDGEKWPTQPLRDFLTEPLRNGHSAKAAEGQEGIRTLTLTAVTARDFSEANTKVTVAASDKVKDLWLRPGDILIERSNTADLVGSAAIYEGEEDWAIFPDLMIRVRVGGTLLPGFLEIVLRTPRVRQYFRTRAQGISGSMPKISQPIVEALPIPVPPTPVQEEALSEDQRLSSIVSSLRRALTAAERRATGLRRTILRDAFAGRLLSLGHETETNQPQKVTA